MRKILHLNSFLTTEVKTWQRYCSHCIVEIESRLAFLLLRIESALKGICYREIKAIQTALTKGLKDVS